MMNMPRFWAKKLKAKNSTRLSVKMSNQCGPNTAIPTRRKVKKNLKAKSASSSTLSMVFNATHVVPGFDMTIDEMLVYIPQLTRRKAKLAEMKAKLPKSRVSEVGARISNVIDYTYLNYDLAEVEADYERVSDELSDAQLALDAVNSSETFEFDF